VNIAVNLLQVQTSDGFDVLCDSVFSSCMDNGIASFVFNVLDKPGQQDDELATDVEDSNTSKDAEDPNTSSEITPAVIQVSQNPFSDLRAIIRTSGRKATEVDRLITSLETSSVLADQDKRLLNKICSTYLFANYGKKV
jgi:hypothetical protein